MLSRPAIHRHFLGIGPRATWDLLCTLAALTLAVTVLVQLDGARGAAIGTAAVEIGMAVVGGVLLVRGRPHLRPRLAVVPKVALASLLGAGPMLVEGLPVLARLALSSAIYGVVLLAVRAFPEELRTLLPTRLHRSL